MAKKKAESQARAKAKARPPKEDLVVFAFRLTQDERQLIHKAAGSGSASKFVRALAVAASQGDTKTVTDIVGSIQ